MSPKLAKTSQQISACFSVMRALRPHLTKDVFVAQVQRQMQAGYQLAYMECDGVVVTVAGFRISENLAWGRFLYVDDLVTDEAVRSRGYGALLLEWLKLQAKSEGCQQLHLDSGVQRKSAHRFYEREGMQVTSLHFMVKG